MIHFEKVRVIICTPKGVCRVSILNYSPCTVHPEAKKYKGAYTIDNLKLSAYIHTLSAKGENVIGLDLSEQIRKNTYLKNAYPLKNGGVSYILNINKYWGNDSNARIENITDFGAIFQSVCAELEQDNLTITRVDIAIDTKKSFSEMYHYNTYLARLYQALHKTKNAFKATNLDGTELRSINVAGKKIHLCIYDKDIESNGRSEYKTRVEFRLLNRKIEEPQELKAAIIELKSEIEKLPKMIAPVTKELTQTAIEIYFKGRYESAREFIKRNTFLFLNNKTFNNFYYTMFENATEQQKNSFAARLKKLCNLQFISNKKMCDYINQIAQAIDEYIS